MSVRTHYIQKTVYIVSWIIFIAVCIEAGSFIFSTMFTLLLGPQGAHKFWKPVDLSKLYNYDQSRFVMITSLMIIVAIMRALMFYIIVKIFHDKKLDLTQPFNEAVKGFVLKITYLAFGIALFSFWGQKLSEGLESQGVIMPGLQKLGLGGADVWLFMGVTLLVIAEMFKKGIELQEENDLTV